MCIEAKRDIHRGEEILVNYNYKISDAAEWYQHQWIQHLRNNLSWTEKKIEDWAKTQYRVTGFRVDIPPV